MRSDFKEAKISLSLIALILALSIVFYFFVSMFTSMGYEGYRKAKASNASNAFDKNESQIVVIDAGHGGEDPGANENGLLEKDLNLEISVALGELLNACGYQAELTREDDRLLYKSGEENRKKYHDLRNREDFANKFDRSIFVSVHMNKFPLSYCKGLQTFYSENNPKSFDLANIVQENSRLLQPDNKREVKSGNETIYLLENLEMPAVLIECGFLSNPEEFASLSDEDYRKALVLTLYCSISEFLENSQ